MRFILGCAWSTSLNQPRPGSSREAYSNFCELMWNLKTVILVLSLAIFLELRVVSKEILVLDLTPAARVIKIQFLTDGVISWS